MHWQNSKGSLELSFVDVPATNRVNDALNCLKAGNHAEAKIICNELLLSDPANNNALYLLGISEYQTGNIFDAIRIFKNVLSNNPAHKGALINLVNIYKNSKDYAAAVSCLIDYQPEGQNSSFIWPELVTMAAGQNVKLQDAVVVERILATPTLFTRLQIEINTYCNLKCAECPRTVGINNGTWANRNMDIDLFKQIIEKMPPSNNLILQGVGEPTMHPELLEMVRHARSLGKFRAIGFNSNALARSVDFFKQLKEAGLTNLSISVDSFNQDIADICRYGTNVAKLKKRITEISKIFNNIIISIVVSKNNMDDIVNTLAELSGIGSFYVEMQTLISYRENDENNACLTDTDIERLNNMLASSNGKWPGITVMLPDNIRQNGNLKKCIRPFFAPYVTVDGYMTPCCTTENQFIYSETSANQPINSIWQSDNVKNWLRDYLIKQPEICNGCCFNPVNTGIKHAG